MPADVRLWNFADSMHIKDLRQLLGTDGKITDAMMVQLQKHFDDDAIVELTGLLAFQNMSSKFNAALDFPPQGFCQVPNLKID